MYVRISLTFQAKADMPPSQMKKLKDEALILKKGRDPVLYQLTHDGGYSSCS